MNIKQKILDIKNRGLIKESTNLDKLVELVISKKTVYCGFDPSSDSLHIGHLVPLKLVKELHDLGCPVIILLGSITVKLGDSSFCIKNRKNYKKEVIKKNIKKIKEQIFKLIPDVKIIDNKEWYDKMKVIDFFEKVGGLFTINKMLERKSIKKSLESKTLDYSNFSYVLMQAYDFYYLWKNYNVAIQVGGSDQFPNITFGIEMIKRIEKKLDEKKSIMVVGLTTPLLIKSTGKKFSKSTKNNIWLDSKKTRLFDFFQFVFNINDEDIKIWNNLFISKKFKNNEIRGLQKKIGFFLINWITNDNLIELKIKDVFNIIKLKEYSKKNNFKKLIEILGKNKIETNTTLINILNKLNIFDSFSDIKRLIEQGGIKIFDKKIIDINYKLTKENSINNYILLKKGKNNWFIFYF